MALRQWARSGAALRPKSNSVLGLVVFFQWEFGNGLPVLIHYCHLPIRNCHLPIRKPERKSARSFLAISPAPLRAASTFGKSSPRSATTVVLFENSTLNFGMSNGQRGRWQLSCVSHKFERSLRLQVSDFEQNK
jgi:hypothetical protein